MPKISVVVPVYNTEKYLHSCIDSILAQTFTDFELLLIDDGSTDRSGEICDEYIKKDSRVRCLHKTNGGANEARKLGVENACGDYVMFVDSDDLILRNGIENLLAVVLKNPMANIIVAHMKDECKTVSNFEYVVELFNGKCSSNLWSKLYQRSIIEDHFCDISKEYPMGEDLLQNVNIGLSFSGSVIYCNTKFYDYRRNCLSISNTFVSTQTYENKFHALVGQILDVLCFSKDVSRDIKLKIWINWQKSRINGYKQIILNNGVFNYHDYDFMNMKQLLKPYIKHFNVEDKIVLYIANKRMCCVFLSFYYKIRHIYSILRKYMSINRLSFNLL